MAFFNTQTSLTATITENKKTILLAGIGLFCLVLIGSLLAGIFASSQQQSPQAQSTQEEQAQSSGEISTTPSLEPSNEALPNQNIAANPSEQPKYQYIPEPTFDIDSVRPTKIVTPTPTPLPGPFYIANGKQNDLIIKLYKREDWDLYYEVQIINTRTRETRLLGYQYEAAPGDSAFFSKDFSQVIFVGGSKTDYQKVTAYSIPLQKAVKSISLDQMRAALPGLQFQKTATLSRMVLSPDGKKVALSYGNTYNITHIDPNTSMIVINLTTNRMQLLQAKGLVKNWKDETTIEYELPPGNPAGNPVQEIKVSTL